MGYPEQPLEVEVTVADVETASTVFSAVHEVHGERHPLVSPTSSTAHLRTALEVVPLQQRTFGGGDAATIVKSLELTAQNDSSPYKKPARLALGSILGEETDYKDSAEPAKPNIETPAKPLQQRPRVRESELVEGHIELYGFGELVTALRAVEAFSSGFGRLSLNRRKAEIAARLLLADMLPKGQERPFIPKPNVYWGGVGAVIYSSLERAAERGETIYDAAAEQMLNSVEVGTESGDQLS